MAIQAKYIQGMPLFLGLTLSQLQEVANIGHINRRFVKRSVMIAEEGKPCTDLTMVLSGKVEVTTYSNNRAYRLVEYVDGPCVIEPEKLFGITTRYQATYQTHTACVTITIPKETLNIFFEKFMIIRLNLLNLICKRAQQLERRLWHIPGNTLEERIASFIKQKVLTPAGKKILYIKMTTLAEELNSSRLEISEALGAMEDKEKIIHKRGIIEVPEIQLL